MTTRLLASPLLSQIVLFRPIQTRLGAVAADDELGVGALVVRLGAVGQALRLEQAAQLAAAADQLLVAFAGDDVGGGVAGHLFIAGGLQGRPQASQLRGVGRG